MKRNIFVQQLFPFFMTVILLVGCGDKALDDYGVLKSEGEASGEEIPIGTYDSKNIVFAYKNADSPFNATELYVSLDYTSEGALGRRNLRDVEEYCYFLPELKEGRYQSSTVTFEYESEFNLEDGNASAISNATATVGSIAGSDTTFVQGFLNAASASLKSFLTQYRFAEDRGETWVIGKLENMGYVFTIHDDADSKAYLSNKIKTDYNIDVEVQKRYMGYVTIEQQTWNAEVIVFKNEEQSTAYYYKRYNEDNHGSQYSHHYRTRNVYVFTNWIDAWIEVSSSATE
ncbi:MAG: hypothetical protein EOM74_01750 [Methanomicrobia archaeon]|nr:hypothetical protein [Methanomicrobia archaeon]